MMILGTNNCLWNLGRIGILALTLLFILAACSDNGDDTVPTQTSPPTTATAQPEAMTPTPRAEPTPTDSPPTATAEPTAMTPALRIVTTTSIVADWVKNIGGDHVEVFSLVPTGADPHGYQPGAQDVARVADADLVLTIGLGLEESWLDDLIRNASPDESRIFVLGNAIDPIEFEEPGGHGMEEEQGALAGRLLIADRDQASLSVLDLRTELLSENSLQVAAPGATLYSSPSGRFAFALARGPEDDDDRVHIIDGGVYLEPHEGHMDLVTGPVSLLSLGTSDERPIHTSVHNGWTAIFHDGSGRAALFEEHALEEERDDYDPIWLEAGLQHGAVVPLGEDFFMVTSNNPDYPDTVQSSLPIGAEIRTVDNQVVYDASDRSCPGMHGEAANHDGVLMGCVGGVLFIEGHDGEYEHKFIDNPDGMSEAGRIGTVWGHEDSPNFFGSASYRHEGASVYDGLWMIDAEGGSVSRVLPSEEDKRVYGAAFDAHGEEFFALTADGMINVISPASGEIEETIRLMDSFDGDTSPYFIVVGEVLYLSDRAGGRIVEFHLAEGEIEREWSIGGNPGRLAFVGVGGGEEGDDHAEEHGHGPLDPHFWFDPLRVKIAVNDIAARLSVLDPQRGDTYRANASTYNTSLDQLHTWTQDQVRAISQDNRLLVTSHDSLGYFATLYSFEVVGVILGATTEVDPSAADLTELIHEVEESGAKAIFGETTVSERLAQTVATESGATLVRLYSGSLGLEESGAGTYIDMIRTNVERIVEALR